MAFCFDRWPRSDGERNQADKVRQQSNEDLKESDHSCDHAQCFKDTGGTAQCFGDCAIPAIAP